MCCEKMEYYLNCEKPIIIRYVSKFDEYGIVINEGPSKIRISYCPWCGTKLPESKREEWFKRLEELGFDDPFSQDVPIEYQTDEWYRNK